MAANQFHFIKYVFCDKRLIMKKTPTSATMSTHSLSSKHPFLVSATNVQNKNRIKIMLFAFKYKIIIHQLSS